MYSSFYGFSEKPFDVTPDPKYLYLNEGYREILASLVYGIRERRGFIALVGEVGTGKTTLIHAALDRLDQTTKVARLFNTDLTFEQMLSMALVDFGAVKRGRTLSKPESLHLLNDFAIRQFAKGGNVLMVVDEAQNLDRAALESLRLLSNLETRKHKLIQIVLSGQPELDAKLNDPNLRQLAQRISIRRRIAPLSEREVHEYIDDRLTIANYRGPTLFTDGALRLICEYSGGIPRKINILCDNALLLAYGLGRKKIKPEVIKEVIKDQGWSPHPPNLPLPAGIVMKSGDLLPKPWLKGHRYRLGTGLGLAACAIAGVFFVPQDSKPPHLIRAAIMVPPGLSKHSPASASPVVGGPVEFPPSARSAAVQKDRGPVAENPAVAQTRDVPKPVETKVTAKPQAPVSNPGMPQRDTDQPHKEQATQGRAPSAEKEASMESAALPKEQLPKTNVPAQPARSKASTPKSGNLVIQIGAFGQEVPAKNLMSRLEELGYTPYLQTQTSRSPSQLYRVRIRGYAGLSEARTVIAQLREQGFKDVFIVQSDGR